MLLSISLILLVGMSMGWICKKVKLPSLLGMMLTGIVLGPYVLNLLDESILGISADLRKIALIIILTRAGITGAQVDGTVCTGSSNSGSCSGSGLPGGCCSENGETDG